MKFGIRKPSIKKSIKARTVGKLKRKAKKAINPLYGKKGMGYIKNPKKAIYNNIYNKTSVGISDLLKTPSTSKSTNTTSVNGSIPKNKWISLSLCIFLGCFGFHKFYEGNLKLGIIYLFTLGLFGFGWFFDIIVLLFKPNPYYI